MGNEEKKTLGEIYKEVEEKVEAMNKTLLDFEKEMAAREEAVRKEMQVLSAEAGKMRESYVRSIESLMELVERIMRGG